MSSFFLYCTFFYIYFHKCFFLKNFKIFKKIFLIAHLLNLTRVGAVRNSGSSTSFIEAVDQTHQEDLFQER